MDTSGHRFTDTGIYWYSWISCALVVYYIYCTLAAVECFIRTIEDDKWVFYPLPLVKSKKKNNNK